MDQDPKEQFHNLLWHVWRKFPRLRECKRQHFFVGKLLFVIWRLGHLCTYENKTFRKKFTLVPLLRLCALFWNKLITLDRPSLPTQPHFWSGCFHLKSVKKRKNRKSRLLTQTKTRLTIKFSLRRLFHVCPVHLFKRSVACPYLLWNLRNYSSVTEW